LQQPAATRSNFNTLAEARDQSLRVPEIGRSDHLACVPFKLLAPNCKFDLASLSQRPDNKAPTRSPAISHALAAEKRAIRRLLVRRSISSQSAACQCQCGASSWSSAAFVVGSAVCVLFFFGNLSALASIDQKANHTELKPDTAHGRPSTGLAENRTRVVAQTPQQRRSHRQGAPARWLPRQVLVA
jgi:hypothetical protein